VDEMVDTTVMINAAVLVGVAVVLPLALGHARRWWVAAIAGVVSMLLPTGSLAAGLTAGVWVAVALLGLVEAARVVRHDLAARRPQTAQLVPLGTAAYALVGAVAFLASRTGRELFGIGEPIVELTAVHFTYAGVGALVLAGAALREATGRRVDVARAAVLLTLGAPPVVGLGFVTGSWLPQVGGAVLMTMGVLTTAALQLCEAATSERHPRATRTLLAVSGLAPWLPMGLAVAWAASLYWRVPALDVAAMVPSHGSLNTVFVVLGLWARRRAAAAGNPDAEQRSADRTGVPA
jgi:YndJ-like protein